MDIGVQWSIPQAAGDWSFQVGDLTLARDIESAVVVSLFSDRLADADYRPTDGTTDRRGWWADSLRGQLLGSRLYHLDRSKKSAATPVLLQARDYCREALSWLITDGIAKSVDVSTAWISATALGITIVITKPDGTTIDPFRFAWAWR